MTNVTTTDTLCQRMIEDMTARHLGPAGQKSHVRAYRRFAGWLQRSPDTATADDLRLFQLHLAESGIGTSTRNQTMTGLRFLFRVTLRRHDLAFEIYHLKEPQKVPLILNQDEARLLAKAVRYVAEEHDIELGLNRLPKALRRAADIDRLWQALAEAVSPTCVAVLGLAGRHEHWTVAVDVSPQQIRLYDSGEINALRRRHCTVRKTASNIRLTPVQVFLIERRDAQQAT